MGVVGRGIIAYDEGVSLGPVQGIDGVGAGVSISKSGMKALLSIAGGGGGGMTASDWVAMGLFRPQDFGTIDPTGATDSRAAFQAALDEMCGNSAYGGCLLVPQGRFRIDPASGSGDGLVHPQTPYDGPHGWGYRFGHTMRGFSRGASTLFAGPGLTAPVMKFRTTTANLPSWDVFDVTFQGLAGSTEVVRADELAYSTWKNVTVMGVYGGSPQPPIGLHFANCQINNFENIRVYNADTCILHDIGAGFTYGNNMNVYRNIVTAGSAAWGFDFDGGAHLIVDGIDCEGNSNYPASSGGVRIKSGPFVLRGSHWFEGEYDPHYDVTIGGLAAYGMSVIEGPAAKVTSAANMRVRGSGGSLILRNLGAMGTITADTGTTVIHEDTTSATFSGGGTKVTRH